VTEKPGFPPSNPTGLEDNRGFLLFIAERGKKTPVSMVYRRASILSANSCGVISPEKRPWDMLSISSVIAGGKAQSHQG
jgi:hypothetical protein